MSNSNSNDVKWLVACKGSLRWWSAGTNGHQQVKGTITFEALKTESSRDMPLYRIKYAGDRVMPNGHRTHYDLGYVDVPTLSLWSFDQKKFKSANAFGRSVSFSFKHPSGSSAYLTDKIQFTAPISDTSDSGKLFYEATKKAASERLIWQKNNKDHGNSD